MVRKRPLRQLQFPVACRGNRRRARGATLFSMGAIDIMAYTIIDTGGSRSFPAEHAFTKGAAGDGEVVVIIGSAVGAALTKLTDRESKAAGLLELGTECLGGYTREG